MLIANVFSPNIFSRRKLLQFSGLTLATAAVSACQPISAQPAPVPEAEITNPDEALTRLIEGNQRFVDNRTRDPNQSAARRTLLADGQHPFATIFSCVDSRVPPEHVFDRGLGDLFVIRTAGHVIDSAVLGSLEFGVAELGIPLLVVLGHEKCGAVNATIETLEKHEHARAEIEYLVHGIEPAVEQAKHETGDLLANAVNANVLLTVERLKSTAILSEAVAQNTLKIVGGRYDLASGVVEIVSA